MEDMAAGVGRLIAETRAADEQASMPSEPWPSGSAFGALQATEEPSSPFILALEGAAYAEELAALTGWVEHLLLPVYGREISGSRPWCVRWPEHPEAVARLHGLWLAWQQLTDAEAGLCGRRPGTGTTSITSWRSCGRRMGRSRPAPPTPPGSSTGCCPLLAPRTGAGGERGRPG